MTKENILEIISDKYGMVADREKGFHPEVLAAICELAYNQIIYNLCLVSITHSDYAQLDQYTKRYYNVPVQCNTQNDEWFSELPSSVIPLPMNRGVRYIYPMKDKKTNFIFRENGTSEVFDETEFSLINTIPTYYVENYNVFYDDKMTQEIASNGVGMKLIVPFRSWEDEEILPLPAGKDLDLIAAVEAIVDQKRAEQNKPTANPTPTLDQKLQ